MAFTCGFFNSDNGDRKYNAEQMSAIFDGIIADGVFTTIGDHMAVSAGTGMQVLVGTGKAWFDHTWNVNDAAYPLAIAASDVTLSRIDAIVLETNHSDSVRLNKLRVVQGAVASSPAKPTLTNSEKVHQHPLAWVTVKPGVTQIAASAIENAVGTSACPFVTGIIATTSIDALFNQWNGEFDEWFENLKAQLSDNVVANLQKQIDALDRNKVGLSDKANTQDILAGTSDNKWVTPKGLVESNIAHQVGDILTTARTNLGDSWALCDGSVIDSTRYPKLSDMMYRENIQSTISSTSGSGVVYPPIMTDNDIYACVLIRYDNNNRAYFASLAYTKVPNDSWYSNKSEFSLVDFDHVGLSYINKYIILSMIQTESSTRKIKLHYLTDPSGSFNSITVSDLEYVSSGTHAISNVVYFNGRYILMETGFYRASAASYRINVYSASALTGPWTKVKTISNLTYGSTALNLQIINNQLVTEIYNSSTNTHGLLFSSNGIDYTVQTLTTDSNGLTGCLLFHNGIYMVPDQKAVTDGYQIRIHTSSSLTGPWTVTEAVSKVNNGVSGIVYSRGKYHLFARVSDSTGDSTREYVATNPTGPWTKSANTIPLLGPLYLLNDRFNNIVGGIQSMAVSYGSFLPLIQNDKVNSYIKIK